MTKRKHIDDLWAHIRCLGAVATAGSFTAAASHLKISKASVSQRIAELEEAAGLPLVRRTTRSVALTEAGRRLVEGTTAAYDRIEESFARVKDLSAVPRGLLSVTAPVALGRQVIAPLVPAFLAQCPEVRIQLELSDRLASLATEGFDLAIRHVVEVPETHIATLVCRIRSLLVATPAYLERHGRPGHPDELSGHNCLHYLRRAESARWVFQARGGRHQVEVAVRGNFSADNSEVLRDAALGDLGIALLPDFSAAAELGRGSLVAVLEGWQVVGGFADRLYAVRPRTAHVPLAVAAFVAFLRKVLASGFGSSPVPVPAPVPASVSGKAARGGGRSASGGRH